MVTEITTGRFYLLSAQDIKFLIQKSDSSQKFYTSTKQISGYTPWVTHYMILHNELFAFEADEHKSYFLSNCPSKHVTETGATFSKLLRKIFGRLLFLRKNAHSRNFSGNFFGRM